MARNNNQNNNQNAEEEAKKRAEEEAQKQAEKEAKAKAKAEAEAALKNTLYSPEFQIKFGKNDTEVLLFEPDQSYKKGEIPKSIFQLFAPVKKDG